MTFYLPDLSPFYSKDPGQRCRLPTDCEGLQPPQVAGCKQLPYVSLPLCGGDHGHGRSGGNHDSG